MDNDTMMFAAIFLVAIVVICAGVVMVALNRVGGTSKARQLKRRSNYRTSAAHKAFKDVI